MGIGLIFLFSNHVIALNMNKLTIKQQEAIESFPSSTTNLAITDKDTGITKLALEAMVGTYEIDTDFDFMVRIEDEKLRMKQLWNGREYFIIRSSGNTFYVEDYDSISFTFADLKENKTQTFSLLENGTTTIFYRKERVGESE